MEITNPKHPEESSGQQVPEGTRPEDIIIEETVVETQDGYVTVESVEIVDEDGVPKEQADVAGSAAEQEQTKATEAPMSEDDTATAVQDAPTDEAFTAQESTTQQEQPPYNYYQQEPPMGYPMTAEPSPFSLGWRDIKNAPSAFSSLGIKGLVNCVPILNFCFNGLAGWWGREPVDGIANPLPKTSFLNKQNFISGFFFMVIALVLGFVLGLVNIVPIIGQIACFVGCFFVNTLAFMMYFRYLSFGSFAEAWDFKDIWDKAKRNLSSLWIATFLPSLICGGISVVILCIILSAFGLLGGVGIIGALSQTSGVAAVVVFAGFLGIFMFVLLLCFVVVMFANTIGTLWAARACGYWLARYAPEWNYFTAREQRRAKEAAQAAAQAAAQQAAYERQQQAQAAAQQPHWDTTYQYAPPQQPAYQQTPPPPQADYATEQAQTPQSPYQQQ